MDSPLDPKQPLQPEQVQQMIDRRVAELVQYEQEHPCTPTQPSASRSWWSRLWHLLTGNAQQQ